MAKLPQRLSHSIRRREGLLEKVEVQCVSPSEELVQAGQARRSH